MLLSLSCDRRLPSCDGETRSIGPGDLFENPAHTDENYWEFIYHTREQYNASRQQQYMIESIENLRERSEKAIAADKTRKYLAILIFNHFERKNNPSCSFNDFFKFGFVVDSVKALDKEIPVLDVIKNLKLYYRPFKYHEDTGEQEWLIVKQHRQENENTSSATPRGK
jgi:hypothetical protein